jgi:hypothetical protein
MLLQGHHEQAVIECIKGSLDVELERPVILPTSLRCHPYRIMSRSAAAITIRVIIEQGVQDRF